MTPVDRPENAPKASPSAWSDNSRWESLLSREGCPICRHAAPTHLIAELDGAWLTMPEAAPMRGYVCLVARTHAIELHDLTDAQAAAFFSDARRVSRAIARVLQPIKINYEIHGNTLPHLHLHMFPRYVGDPFEGGPIEPRRIVEPVYAPGEFATVSADLLRALNEQPE